jgi:hypothetical protein
MATYTIEIANRIKHGRAVGTDFVVTRRPEGFSSILARFATRDEAAAWIAARMNSFGTAAGCETHNKQNCDRCAAGMGTCGRCGGRWPTRTSGILAGVTLCLSSVDCDRNVAAKGGR